MNTDALISQAKKLTQPQRREVLARLWDQEELGESGRIWKSVRYGEGMRLVAYEETQNKFLSGLREVLLKGGLARVADALEGTAEIYGPDRTYLVVLTPKREYAALLSSWEPFSPPKEIILEDVA